MMSPIHRVARAIAAERGEEHVFDDIKPKAIVFGEKTIMSAEDRARDYEASRAGFIQMAQAAIKAIREPSETMKREGALCGQWRDTDLAGDVEQDKARAEHVWRAMIDAAMQEV